MLFSRFMEIALYSEPAGYYAGGGQRVGKDGDFYTSVSTGPLFGSLLAGQFLEMYHALGSPRDFTIVEQGANDGRLAADVLSALEGTELDGVRMVLVEPFKPLRERQAQTLRGHRVEWVLSASALGVFTGVHFSNELFDALPFEILRSSGEGWHAMRVVEGNGGFVFEPSPDIFVDDRLPLRPAGFLTETRPSQNPLLRAVSEKLLSGFLLAIDYGMSRRELLAPHRPEGTFACYSKHCRDSNPLDSPGSKDITAHVDFSALARCAVAHGFELRGFADQHHFLVGASAGLLSRLEGALPGSIEAKLLRSLKTLMHPESMGAQFKALLLARDVPQGRGTSGFQFAREAAYLLDERDDELLSPCCG